jgi:hypothetical protein
MLVLRYMLNLQQIDAACSIPQVISLGTATNGSHTEGTEDTEEGEDQDARIGADAGGLLSF